MFVGAPVLPVYLYERGIADTLDAMQDLAGVNTVMTFSQKFCQSILFADAAPEYAYPMYLSMLGYDPDVEPTLAQQRAHDTAFSREYVYQECRRAVKNVQGQVYVRIGFDMPGYDCHIRPEQVYHATTRALESGVDGLWCGREWDELQPDNAAAFGNAVRDDVRAHR